MINRRTNRVERLEDYAGHRWVPLLRRVDAAVATGDDTAAERAWHEACSVALRAKTWQALLAVGDAYRRIGDAPWSDVAADALVSQIYKSGLLSAVRDRSMEGVLRLAERLTALGDEASADEALAVAARLVDEMQDVAARKRLDAIRAGWADHWLTAAATA